MMGSCFWGHVFGVFLLLLIWPNIIIYASYTGATILRHEHPSLSRKYLELLAAYIHEFPPVGFCRSFGCTYLPNAELTIQRMNVFVETQNHFAFSV